MGIGCVASDARVVGEDEDSSIGELLFQEMLRPEVAGAIVAIGPGASGVVC